MGWRDAIVRWTDEINEVVATTNWGGANTTVVQVRGPVRVGTAAQRLLREVQAEIEVEGHRVTPDWYLRFALANECILSLREFAKQLPEHFESFTEPALSRPSPIVKAATGAHALQALAKAQLVVDAIQQAVDNLDNLRPMRDPQPVEELDTLAERVESCLFPVIEHLAEAIVKLSPERSRSSPDLFGQAFYTLIHHTEDAIANGDVKLVDSAFSKILMATLIRQEHVLSTYTPPSYLVNSAIFDPVIDLLELSGLAMIYSAIRDDQSDEPVRQAWLEYIRSCAQPEDAAKRVLNLLDLADGGFWFGISPRSIARTEWEMRLSNRIIEAGYAIPEYSPFDREPTWTAPPLIKMLGVSESMPSVYLDPRTIFASEVIGPLSGEPDEVLRVRPGLQRYYEMGGPLGASEIPEEDVVNRSDSQLGKFQMTSHRLPRVPPNLATWINSAETHMLYQDFPQPGCAIPAQPRRI